MFTARYELGLLINQSALRRQKVNIFLRCLSVIPLLKWRKCFLLVRSTHTRHIIHMYVTLRLSILYVKSYSPPLVTMGNLWIWVVGGTKVITHSLIESIFQDWKDVSSVLWRLEGSTKYNPSSRRRKKNRQAHSMIVVPFPTHVYICIVCCVGYKKFELLKHIRQIYVVSSSELLYYLLWF